MSKSDFRASSTAYIAGNAQREYDFYTRVLGLDGRRRWFDDQYIMENGSQKRLFPMGRGFSGHPGYWHERQLFCK